MHDIYKDLIKGNVKWCFHKEGLYLPYKERSNVIAYSGADIMARLLGGDSSYYPNCIGFMYGTDATAASLVDPDSLPDSSRRIHSWDVISYDVVSITKANILITPLVLNPSWEATSSVYSGNAVTVSSHTGVTTGEYAFSTDPAGSYAPELATNNYFYHALLMNKRTVGQNTTYTVFSRVTLKGESAYDQKPANFDLAVFWTISLY